MTYRICIAYILQKYMRIQSNSPKTSHNKIFAIFATVLTKLAKENKVSE